MNLLVKKINEYIITNMVRNGQGLAHQSILYTNAPIYCDGKLFGITLDLKPFFEKRRALLSKERITTESDSF